MMRLLGFALRLVLIVALALWLADQPGTAHIVWHDYVIDTSAAVLGLGALGIGFVFYLLFRLWHFLRYGPERWRLSRKLRRLRQGQDHLTGGFVAIALGDAAEAGRLAVAARKRLGPVALTRLLQAQAAELAGDDISARTLYQALSAEPDNAALGYRGLILAAQRAGDEAEAERIAAQMRRLTPDAPWLHLFDFETAARRASWDEAHAALALLAPTRLLEPERYRRYRAALLLTQSQAAAKRGDTDAALASAEQAARQSPGWLPAILAHAEAQGVAGHRRAALRLIEKNWARQSHPRLALFYRNAEADSVAAYAQIEKLVQRGTDEVANGMALAEAAFAADLWGQVRRHLLPLIGRGDAPAPAYHLMAQVERRENGNETAARQWIGQAAHAPAGKAWICEACGAAHDEWQPVCSACGSFASLQWQMPRDAGLRDDPPRLLTR